MKNVTTIDMKNLLYLVPSRFERKVDFPQCQFLEVRVKKDMQDVGALLNLNMVIFQLGQHTNTIVEKCKNRLTKIQSKRFVFARQICQLIREFVVTEFCIEIRAEH